jgi:hypothetical protein
VNKYFSIVGELLFGCLSVERGSNSTFYFEWKRYRQIAIRCVCGGSYNNIL